MDTTESTRIITSVLSFFQDLHTCPVDSVQFLSDTLLILSFQTSATLIIAVHQTVFCYISLISAVTPAVPVYRTAAVSFIRGIQRRQTPEAPSGDIYPVVTVVMGSTPTAFYFSCLQVMGCYSLFSAAVTLTQPAGATAPVLRSSQDSQMSEYLACQVFRDSPSARCLPLNASAVLYRSPDKFSCICKNFSSTVTAALPYSIPVLCLVCLLYNCQLSKSLPGQFFSPGHLVTAFLVLVYKTAGKVILSGRCSFKICVLSAASAHDDHYDCCNSCQ